MKLRWIGAAYSYAALHVACWRILLESNGHQAWERPFSIFFFVFFLPLNIMAGAMCEAVWGTFNIFQARYVFGIVIDVAIASFLSVTIIALGGQRWNLNEGVLRRGEVRFP